MATPAMGKRTWTCPECQQEVELSIAQLDPMACDACMGRRRQPTAPSSASAPAGPSLLSRLPDVVKIVGGGVIGLLLGLLIGFVAGRLTAPKPAVGTAATTTETKADADDDDQQPDMSTYPGPGYKWSRGRTRKDGTRGPGYWSKDQYYKGERGDNEKSKK